MITGVVLAGGSSSRMKREKALSPLAGKPLVVHVAEALMAFADEVIVSVGPGRSEEYAKVLPADVRTVEDVSIHAGPIEGLRRSIEHAKGEWIAVSPCDTPFLNVEVYSLMISNVHDGDGAAAVIGGYVEPLHVVLRRDRAAEALANAVRSGETRVSAVLGHMDLVLIDEQSVRTVDRNLVTFWNLNSPEEMAQAESLVSKP